MLPVDAKWIRGALGFAISAVLLGFTVRSIAFDDLLRVLKASSPQWIAVSIALYWLEIVVRSTRWRRLLRPVAALGPRQVLLSLIVGYAANNALPARLGELFRADFIGKRYGVSRMAVMGTIVLERVLDVLAVVACAAAGVMTLAGDRPAAGTISTRSSIVDGLFVTGAVALGFVVALIALAAYGRSAASLRSAQLRWAFTALAIGLRPVSEPRELLPLIAPSLLVWTLNGVAMWAMLTGVGVRPTPATIVLLIGVAGIAAALPAAPANLGTLQFAFVIALGTAGHAAAPAFAAATLVQVLLLGSVTVVGAILYAWLHRTRKAVAR
nr:lysylphosphatidylglycerol synthase transmembrane domain-containing protein [Schlegelella koreensis]